MLLYSKTLQKDINFTTFEKMDDFGKPMKIILHDSLQDVIHNTAKVKYDFSFVSADPTHCVVVCSMADASGRIIREIGESLPATLDNEIAQNYPALIASQRAFDRAAIRYLNLPGKVFSNMEISIIDGNLGEVSDIATDVAPQSAGVISSIVQDDEMMNINTPEEFTIETDIDIDESMEIEEDTVVQVAADESVLLNEEVDIGVVDVTVGASDDLPFDIDIEEEEDYGNHVITMNGKYAGRNKTIAEIYKENAGWVEWIGNKFTPSPDNEVAKKDVEAIKQFLKNRGN